MQAVSRAPLVAGHNAHSVCYLGDDVYKWSYSTLFGSMAYEK